MGFSQPDDGRRVTPNMNVTPLVDVVLVLLIIFMVVTPMLMKRFHVRVPEKVESQAPAEDQAAPIVVTVGAGGQIALNQEPLDDVEFETRLREVFAVRTERIVFVAVDDAAPYERAVEVMDRARGGGADPLVLMTEGIPGGNQ
jgi:biopolymer transport protein ExbD/biopolymer transport protein TolR